MVRFANLLNRRVDIKRQVWTAHNEFGDREETWVVSSANVPCRREPSEATDNVDLNIGDGEQLRIQEVFFFNPDVDVTPFDHIELLTRDDEDAYLNELGEFKILAVDMLEGSKNHHLRIEAIRIYD